MPTVLGKKLPASEKQLDQWLEMYLVDTETRILVEASDSRLESILRPPATMI